MKFITSINPNNISIAKKCLSTWTTYLPEIVAVQTPSEIATLQDAFPTVSFVETTEGGDVFDSIHCPRIHTLINQAPGIIINSDISIIGKAFSEKFLTHRDKVLECGVRYDDPPIKLHRYGIDVFKITEELKNIYEDTPFTIGQPGWDYYMILEASNAGYYINAHKRPVTFLHKVHPINWAPWKLSMAHALLEKRYNSDRQTITKTILRLTGR